MIWTTKEGIQINIKNMTDNHLNNTITFLDRRIKEFDELPYPCFQGEMAQYYAEKDYEDLEPRIERMSEFKNEMIKEAEKRGVYNE